MPIYEYECSQCAHRIEVLQKISDPPLRDCPACDTPSLRKLVSAASFRLKGTGWYETDFKNKDKPKPAAKKDSATKENDDKGKQSDTKKDTSTSESKPKETKKSDSAQT
uniref:Putative regulatory protein, FmdB family n=2 Tax=unclassified Candidatus Kentrum TaxID=2643149 RepID=A0A451APF2_9GAMM|nr:MAG: putative regulatory protein, FmdB family [Candidatus Kentron sp. LPFa]VFK26515.1 MAG: putative regulatory protein, FmdB family [Candidatus Kentron sp. LPFa]VFK67907.1 MAG: putative regulatory protein, FmdB family [Candidatus Kentron sp. UNK]VFK73193.1 MAG: putative regulatory protein, FmdB family [Candidatus Kentron sp. UNK]